MSVIPKVCIKLEFIDQLIRIPKGAQFSRFDAVRVAPRPCCVVSTLQKHANTGLTVTRAYAIRAIALISSTRQEEVAC